MKFINRKKRYVIIRFFCSLPIFLVLMSLSQLPEAFQFGSELLILLQRILQAYLASLLIFYFGISLESKIVKNQILRGYDILKNNCIFMFLENESDVKYNFSELIDPQKFKGEFQKIDKTGQSMWDKVSMKYINDPKFRYRLINEFKKFSVILKMLVPKLDIPNQEDANRLYGLILAPHELHLDDDQDDSYKKCLRYLWYVFTNFSIEDGDVEDFSEFLNKL